MHPRLFSGIPLRLVPQFDDLPSPFTFPLASYATHISGADITYRWISGNTFELNLTLYRDCSGIAAEQRFGQLFLRQLRL